MHVGVHRFRDHDDVPFLRMSIAFRRVPECDMQQEGIDHDVIMSSLCMSRITRSLLRMEVLGDWYKINVDVDVLAISA
jgi:hypothetical protein